MKHRFLSALLCAALCTTLTAPVSAAEPQTAHASQRTPFIFIEGVNAMFLDSEQGLREPIAYEDALYIPLATVGLWMGADATWDPATKTARLTSNGREPFYVSGGDINQMNAQRPEGIPQYQYDMKNGVTVELPNGVTVLVNGEAVNLTAGGRPVSPILFRQCLYLPLDTVAQLLGKQMLRCPWGNGTEAMVFLFDPPTQSELDEISAYFAVVSEHVSSIRALLTEAPSPQSDEEFTDYIRLIQADLMAITGNQPPSFSGAAPYMDMTYKFATLVLYSIDPYLPEEEASDIDVYVGHAPSYFLAFSPEEKWSYTQNQLISPNPDSTTNFMSLEKFSVQNQIFASTVAESLGAPPSASAPSSTGFSDAAEITHQEAVSTLVQLGVINGKADGSFAPAAPVTRGEAAKLIAILAGDPEPSGEAAPFSDIGEHWAKRYIESCAQMGIISGRGDGTFDPDGEVTLYELAKMVLTMLGYEDMTGALWLVNTDRNARTAGLTTDLTEGTPAFASEGAALDAVTPLDRDRCAQLLYNSLTAVPYAQPEQK